MIPYVVINGVSSKTVNGLLIQSLPPISKPKQRTKIEEIDGKDGDIVTTLGYSAYDKPIKIGLYGDYNVDDVIDFFNTEGTIVFSNEPDKYYKFALYDAINFEKLIRFKTATVNIHVQPFKYSEDETTINYAYSNGTTSANISVRNDGNIYSKPTLTITGKGAINVYLGNTQILDIALDDTEAETIIINAEQMNAYDSDGNYMNRQVTGNYDNLIFKAGVNNLIIEGYITSVSIDNYSRWI
jgi:predicted phage tail component-like protein